MIGDRYREQILGLLVALVAFLVYSNSLRNGFVWDDTNVIIANPALRGPSLSLFSSIDTTRDYELLPYYRPLTLLTFLIEERLHGVNPFLMHLLNVLLHAASACLVYYLARSFFKDNYASLFAGLLFAVHPINAEAVDFISGGRNTMLACFFVLLAWLLYRRSILDGKSRFAVAGAAFYVAGLFSKETSLAALPLILVQEIASLREKAPGERFRIVMRMVPYVAGTVCYLVLRWMTLAKLDIQTSIIPGFGSQKLHAMYKIPDLWTRLWDNTFIIPRYLLTMIRPTALSPRYVIPEHVDALIPQLAFAWVFIIATLSWLLTRGRSRATLFGLAWLMVFWLPVSGLVMFPSAPMADRYMYTAAIGLWLVVADQTARLFARSKRGRSFGMVAVALVLVVLAGLTIRRNLDWESDITLFSRFVEQYPGNAYAHAGLGNAYYAARQVNNRYLDLAEQELREALEIKSIIQGVHTALGNIRLTKGDNEAAVHYYTLALGIYPLDKEALLNRAITFENLGRSEEALEDFQRFLSVPGYELADARPYAEARVRELSP